MMMHVPLKKICERLQVKWNDSEIVNCFRFSVMSLGVDEEIGWDRVLCDIGCWLGLVVVVSYTGLDLFLNSLYVLGLMMW